MNRAAPRSGAELVALARDVRRATLDLVSDLDDDQLMGAKLTIVNPPLWEIGHVAWFHERWVLREWRGEGSSLEGSDELYNSAAVHHDTRWGLDLPSRAGTWSYMEDVLDRIAEALSIRDPGPEGTYFTLLGIYHECMHAEALTYTRQTHAYPPPRIPMSADDELRRTPCSGDVDVPGTRFELGASDSLPFVFDNEKWAHTVDVEPFAISRCATTQEEFLAFVEDDGYRRRELWSDAGWTWRESVDAQHPVYWRADGDGWHRRHYDTWRPLEPRRPVAHVNWHEADAYCRWAKRRLPTEAEWEWTACCSDTPGKRTFPWGDAPPTPERANLDWRAGYCVDVDCLPEGDSRHGARQMIGNLWEWTASDFGPYPGFSPDAYKEYSEPWFHTHKVLRGGAWPTRAFLLRNTWRNFYEPHRRDVWCGFRTCALE